MKSFLSFALAAALCAPAFAQKTGSTNSNAPALSQSITIGDAKMSLDYTSITWADGKTMARLADKENGGNARASINKRAVGAPLGKFTSSIDCKCGDATLAAGSYDVYFTIGDDLAWSINFKSGDKVTTTKLDLKSGEHESKRLQMLLHATDNGAGAWLSFGKMSGMLAFAPAK